jgi:hypothetical protein
MLSILGRGRGKIRRAEMERTKQSKVVEVDKGVFLVRYATAENESRPPRVKVVVNPKHQKNIELLLSPDHKDPILWQPGSCLVVRASQPGQLFVEVIPIDDRGSAAATVKIEPLGQGNAITAIQRPSKSKVEFSRVRLMGHVAGSGDVFAGTDEWIAGPDAPARIEGLSIDWPGKPEDLDIRYSVKLARPHVASDRMTDLGSYAGTRGGALPVVGVSIELAGQGASGYQLVVEAAFLGAPLSRKLGNRISMSGPTGREPLVGLRLRLDEIKTPVHPEPETGPMVKAQSSGRVRIFRSRAGSSDFRTALEKFCDDHAATA